VPSFTNDQAKRTKQSTTDPNLIDFSEEIS